MRTCCIGNRYFEYKTGPLESSAFLGYIAPEYWIEMPGAAK